ncbi:MAG: sodium-dependent transporter [Muribaculaceae bacterium]|nr:sodium-dependent transporter [Muribaculaceae bacterium]
MAREQFSTRFGAIAATVGSAVGLGNIWRFPYEAGTNGGGAFLLCYIGFVFVLCIPVLIAEFIMGRATRSNVIGAYRRLGGKKWGYVGYLAILSSLMILSFYSVISGCSIYYLIESINGNLFTEAGVNGFHERLQDFNSSALYTVGYTLLFLAFNAAILLRGVAKGIEKMSNVLMPVLFLLLIVFSINSLTMDKCAEGLKFLFYPDFSAITTSTLINAMGQAFFSLSIGMGSMMTYASYFGDETRLGHTATSTAILDTMVAIMAGVIIFPAVFTFGFEPTAGPQLVFEVFPAIFSQLFGGQIWAILFFGLLLVASLTSTVSMSEISIAFFQEEWKMKRSWSVVLSTAITIVGAVLCALSFGLLDNVRIAGMSIFNFFDYTTSNILLPISGLILSIFVGWKLDKIVFRKQLTNDGRYPTKMIYVYHILLKYFAPVCVFIVVLYMFGLI